jgi:hypothetical protein
MLITPSLPENHSHYMASIADKHRALDIPGRRILIVGGSNAAFGIDSELITKELGINCINLGLHAGLGLDFMLREAEHELRDDDIVVLTPEPMLSTTGIYKLKSLAHSFYPPARSFYDRDLDIDFAIHVEQLKERMWAAIQTQQNMSSEGEVQTSVGIGKCGDRIHSAGAAPYSREAFNSNGDHVAHLRYGPQSFAKESFPAVRKWDGVQLINSFADRVRAIVLFSHAPFPKYQMVQAKESVDSWQHQLDRELHILQLNKAWDLALDDECFYDSALHLNARGRHLRSVALVSRLREILDFKKESGLN